MSTESSEAICTIKTMEQKPTIKSLFIFPLQDFIPQQRQSKFFENQPERLFPQTNAAEIPVDLSRKTTIHNKRDLELMQHAELMRQIDKLKNAALQPQLKTQKSAIHLINSANMHVGHCQFYKYPMQHEINSINSKLLEEKQREKYSRPTTESM